MNYLYLILYTSLKIQLVYNVSIVYNKKYETFIGNIIWKTDKQGEKVYKINKGSLYTTVKGEIIVAFIDVIKERARKNKKKIVLPESMDIRTLQAAVKIMKEDIADLVLIGNKEKVLKKAEGYGFDLKSATIINPETSERLNDYIDLFVELRKNKGMTPEKARDLLVNDYIYFGVTMVKAGDADGMVAGACHATADILRPSLQILKTAPGTKLVSAMFVMVVPNCEYGANGTFIFADAGLNQDPTAEELAVIAGTTAQSFELLVQEEPIVAMISHSTKGSAKHPMVDKVVDATRMAKEMYPDVKLDGEYQVDAAIVPSVGAFKAPGSNIAGHANVLVFPNLDAGNNGYKLVQRLAKAEAYGPLTQGIAKPVNDLSRGCSADDIVGVVAITAVQAGAADNK